MKLDIRMPMGLMFTLVGAILTVYGLFTIHDKKLYAHSLGHDINLSWGIVLLVIGLIMVILARRSMRSSK